MKSVKESCAPFTEFLEIRGLSLGLSSPISMRTERIFVGSASDCGQTLIRSVEHR